MTQAKVVAVRVAVTVGRERQSLHPSVHRRRRLSRATPRDIDVE